MVGKRARTSTTKNADAVHQREDKDGNGDGGFRSVTPPVVRDARYYAAGRRPKRTHAHNTHTHTRARAPSDAPTMQHRTREARRTHAQVAELRERCLCAAAFLHVQSLKHQNETMQWMPLDATHSGWKPRMLSATNELLLAVERQRAWMLAKRISNWRVTDHLDEAARRLACILATLRLLDVRASIAAALVGDGRRRGSTRTPTCSVDALPFGSGGTVCDARGGFDGRAPKRPAELSECPQAKLHCASAVTCTAGAAAGATAAG